MNMKNISKAAIASAVILSLLIFVPVNKVKAQFSATISIQTFYDDLAPYGQWIDDPEYGYVWIPDADPGFRPYYTRGHWVMTRYGAMWVSSYSWGWAPFHYGRWAYSSYYGWVWIPDTIWGPAWVSWRSGDDYCGWAPLGPGISVSFTFGRSYSVPYDWWVFVPERYCLSTSFYNYRIAPERNITYVRNTTIVNNTYVNNNVTYAAGPRVNEIEQVTRSNVPVYNVANTSRPGKTSLRGNAVSVYRPQVTKGSSRPVPPSVVSRDQFIKNKTQRNTGILKTNGAERTQKTNQPSQQIERKQGQQQNNNRIEHGKQNQPAAQRPEQKNIRQVPERRQQLNQPLPQTEGRQMPQQNNNRQVIPEPRQQRIPPPQQMEHRQMPEQNNNRQVIPEPRQQTPQQMERRQMPPQNSNRPVMPERQQGNQSAPQQQARPGNQPAPQQQARPGNQPPPQQQARPGNNGKGKGHN
jgi:hypothetical protein